MSVRVLCSGMACYAVAWLHVEYSSAQLMPQTSIWAFKACNQPLQTVPCTPAPGLSTKRARRTQSLAQHSAVWVSAPTWQRAAQYQHLHQTTTPDTSGCFSMSTCRLPLLSKCSMSWKLIFPAFLYLHNRQPVIQARGAARLAYNSRMLVIQQAGTPTYFSNSARA